MSQIDENVTVIHLNEGTKKLLALMHFEPIPDEAKYLGFFPDGNAQFFESLDLSVPFLIGAEMTIVRYHTGVTLEFYLTAYALFTEGLGLRVIF